MPLPKRRHSRQRGRKRRTGWKLAAPTIVDCPHCHEPKPPHRVCPHCGYYAGKEVVVVKKEKEKK
ncbi:50S ribosomal protein L32 [candidate division WOR-3 bacterium]|nr:50S ribosomal protein L32 [candidate division WOR-3 bacterium]